MDTQFWVSYVLSFSLMSTFDTWNHFLLYSYNRVVNSVYMVSFRSMIIVLFRTHTLTPTLPYIPLRDVNDELKRYLGFDEIL